MALELRIQEEQWRRDEAVGMGRGTRKNRNPIDFVGSVGLSITGVITRQIRAEKDPVSCPERRRHAECLDDDARI
jgi:hypothetical protein